MNDTDQKIEKRLQNMKDFYVKAEDLIDKLPAAVPEKVRSTIKEKVLGDKDLKKLMEGIDSNRPPRIFLIGRTGVGKSSLINALCGAYVAKVSNIKSGTEYAETYQCKDGERVLMEIFDTRGIAESESLNSEISAEDMLIDEINMFSPDVAIMMLNCTHRDDIVADIDFLKKVSKQYENTNKVRLPIVVAINKCDEMAPARIKDPNEYSMNKIDNIESVVRYYKEIIIRNGLKIDSIVPVSSLIDWKTKDGIEVDAEEIANLPKADVENLEMAFDGRYNIEELLNILEEAILDFEAQMGLRMAARLTDVVNRFSNHLVKIFSGISATVALSPIPISDIYILIILQCILVAMIASLSSRDISLDTAKEFVLSVAGVAGGGHLFKIAAQQLSKLINVVWPGVGSAVSATVAYIGTYAMGKSAISYYINGKNLEEVKSVFAKSKEEAVYEE